MSAGISITALEKRGMLHEDYQPFGPKQNCQDTLPRVTQYTERCKAFVGHFKRYGTLLNFYLGGLQ